VKDNKRKIDSRFRGNDITGRGNDITGRGNDITGRGNDITGRGNDIIEKKSLTHNLCITSRLTGKLGNWITNILYDIRATIYKKRKDVKPWS